MSSIIPIDEKCTAFIQEFFGFSLKACCIEHDYGGTDERLLECVADLAPYGITVPVALVMYFGVRKLKPLYKWLLNIKERVRK